MLHTAIEQIASKLASAVNDISDTVVQKAAEHLRVLETRVTTGKLGKADRKESRAAVLLDLAYRQETGKRLPWNSLAAAIGVKVANLDQLQQKINNYIHDPHRVTSATSSQTVAVASTEKLPVATSHSGKKRARSDQPSSSSSLNDRNRTTRVTGSHSHQAASAHNNNGDRIDALAIRLSDHLIDPHGACKRARQLLADMRDWIARDPSLSASARRGEMYDLQRYARAYEAAALYVVSSTPQHLAGNNSNSTNRTRRNQEDDDEQEGGEQRPMELDDLMDASTEFTNLELKQVLPHVVKMAEILASQRRKKPAPVYKVPTELGAEGIIEDDKVETSGASTVDDLVNDVDELHVDAPGKKEREFLEWRERILSEVVTETRKDLENAKGQSGDSDFSDSAVLALAANDILRRHGLMADVASQTLLD